MFTIDLDTARRFIMGKGGLWPGRRWRGLRGTESAMRALEYLQLDPLQIVARSQDIALQGRVVGYTPGLWEEAAYRRRKFFDWGGWLAVRPMDELPYWRVIMRREREGSYGDPRLQKVAIEHAEAIAEMRRVLQEREVVSNRDFQGGGPVTTLSYRGRKDSALALYYLWHIGEVMTHHRDRFERVYALTAKVAPADLLYEADEAETDRFLVMKEIAFGGLAAPKRSSDSFRRGEPDRAAQKVLAGMLADGEIIEVQVDGWKGIQYALASDGKALLDLSAGRIPRSWKPLETTTTDEAVFLAPLDNVCARGRARVLFGFDYVWEVYKPEHLRKFGYYSLPILWGDRLVGRFDSKLDRTSNTYVILGLWLEEPALARVAAFVEALARGFSRFTAFLGAQALDAGAITDTQIRKRLSHLYDI